MARNHVKENTKLVEKKHYRLEEKPSELKNRLYSSIKDGIIWGSKTNSTIGQVHKVCV